MKINRTNTSLIVTEESTVNNKTRVRNFELGLLIHIEKPIKRANNFFMRSGMYIMKTYNRSPSPVMFESAQILRTKTSLTVTLATTIEGIHDFAFHLVYSPADKLRPFRIYVSASPTSLSHNFDFVVRIRFNKRTDWSERGDLAFVT